MLFDLYGDFSIEAGRAGEIRLPGLVRLAEDLGLRGAAVRAAAGRMVQDGWLQVARRQGREVVYALTGKGRALVEEGRRRIFAPPDEPWDGAWTVVALSVPESRRELRDRMRQELAWLGFGSPSSALYIHPRDHGPDVLRRAHELGAAEYLQIYHSRSQWPTEPRTLVTRAWNSTALGTVDSRYRVFLERFDGTLDETRAALDRGDLTDLRAFQIRFALANQFRHCLFEDPQLPPELSPPEWAGTRARVLFLTYHELVTPAAMCHFDRANAGQRSL